MFKTGSKFLYALAAFGFVAAVVYAVATGGDAVGMDAILGPLTLGYKGGVGDHTGYAVLIGLAGTALFAGIFMSSLRDADPEAEAQVVGLDVVPELVVPTEVNYWPVVGAFSIGAVTLGLATGPTLFVIGMVGLTITTVEWAAAAWAERATGDPEVNRALRNRLMYPVEIPGLAVLGVGGMVLAVSRILLALPKTGSYLVFALVPAAFLAIGALVALRPKLSQSVIAAMLVVGGLAILAGGVAAAIAGPREHEGGHEENSGHGETGSAPMLDPSQTVIRVGN